MYLETVYLMSRIYRYINRKFIDYNNETEPLQQFN